MTISALSASLTASTAGLVRLANGEYTAASVAADPTAAAALDLVKEKDGNYGTATPPPPPAASPPRRVRRSAGGLGGADAGRVRGRRDRLALGAGIDAGRAKKTNRHRFGVWPRETKSTAMTPKLQPA